MNSWKLQNKFVDKVLKGENLFWDLSKEEGLCLFGDYYHFYVIPVNDVYIDFPEIGNRYRNLNKVSMVDGYKKMLFESNASDTLTSMTKDKGTLREFEYTDVNGVRLLYINEIYLKEFGYMKDPERFRVLAHFKDGYKKPVMFFDGKDFTAVVLPVVVGGKNNGV